MTRRRASFPSRRDLPAGRRAGVAVLLALAAAYAATVCPAADQGAAPETRRIAAGRLRITVGDTGLPEQIEIVAAPTDLPLENRGERAPAPAPETLAAIGRGPQLAGPIQLEAAIKQQTVVLEAVEPARIENAGGRSFWRAKLAGGGVNATVEAAYGETGALHGKITYGGGAVDALALVMRLAGPVDTVVAGAAPFKEGDFSLPEGEGLLWGNAQPPVPAPAGPPAPVNRGQPGVPSFLFWGNGDRGFSWLCDAAGWTVTPVAASVTIARDRAGVATWRAFLVNLPTELKEDRTVSFTLLTHPATTPAANRRRVAWLAWPFGDSPGRTVPLTEAVRTGPRLGLLRADCATPFETLADGALLEGPAGGDAASATAALNDTYPVALFRYLAAPHTGLAARLRANSAALVRPGMNPAVDRVAIARALMHDIGFDPNGAAHKVMLIRLVKALSEFGYFENDGQTEFIPYWRSKVVLRYGEPFVPDTGFEETTADPMARVYVSAWIRPAPAGKKGRRAMFLVVNEGGTPVREQFYLLDPKRLFGAPNGFKKTDMIDRWDATGIPEDSDWAKQKLRREGTPSIEMGVKPRGNVPFLLDLEDGGGVAQSVTAKGQEVYQRLFVPARSFRLLYGCAEP